jgi:hypothetical protein
MILFTRSLMPAELRLQSDRETPKSEIYFTDYTLAGQPGAYSFWKSDADRRSAGQTSVHKVGHEAFANFISPITLWLGNPGLIRSGSYTRADDPQGQSVHKVGREALANFISPITL